MSASVILDHVEYYFGSDSKKVKSIILENIREEIKKQAERDGLFPEDYASTLSFVCHNKATGQVLTFSLGDSRIYRVRDGCAEYVNQTKPHDRNIVCSTVSFSAENEAVLKKTHAEPNEGFLLCTDGMWKNAEKAEFERSVFGIYGSASLAKQLEEQKISDDCSFLFVA